MPDSRSVTVGFVGAGRTAGVLARALASHGYSVTAINSRTLDSAKRLANSVGSCEAMGSAQEVADKSKLVFITTPDSLVEDAVEAVHWTPEHMVVHCSGTLTLGALASAAQVGAWVGSFHPFQTFTGGSVDTPLAAVTFGIGAEEPFRSFLSDMALVLGGSGVFVPESARALYHAAAVMSCGYLISVIGDAVELWKRAGLPEKEAIRAIGKLAETTVHNFVTDGLYQSITGPVARGDLNTVLAHLNAIQSDAPEMLDIYVGLCTRAVAVLAAQGKLPVRFEWERLLDDYRQGHPA